MLPNTYDKQTNICMAKTAKEVTSDIKIIIDGNNTNELSEFDRKILRFYKR